MSSGAVRSEFRAQLQASFPAVGYVETIATRNDNNTLPDLWLSLGFTVESDIPISLGAPACWRERGVVRVWVAARAGQGDAVAVGQCDAVAAAFRRYQALAGNLRVVSMTPAQSTPETDGRWLVMAVDLLYQFDRNV